MDTFFTWILYFYIYCFIGWVWESCWVSLHSHHWVNRGFLRGPYLPIYGTGAIVMLIVAMPFRDNIYLTFFAGLVGATLLEYITGVCMENLFKVRYWDYSNQPFNFQGQICLSSSLCWGVFTVILTRYGHKPVQYLVSLLPFFMLILIDIAISVVFVIDSIHSFQEAMDLRHLLEDMTKAKEQLELMHHRLDAALEETGARIEEHIDEFKMTGDRISERIDEFKETTANRSSELRTIISNNLKRLSEYISDMTEEQRAEFEQSKHSFEAYKQSRAQRIRRITPKKKLLGGNPHATSRHYAAALNEIKEYLELQTRKKSDKNDSSKQ
ncbi:MAG: hypothetical protein MSG78_08590 [Clostridiales bacterium]|nr:hypothetical protein [Clostridiales bacterium]